jgi:hypothetical protein
MNKKLKAAFYTFLALLLVGLAFIGAKTYPYETMMIIVILCTCFLIFFFYHVISNFID